MNLIKNIQTKVMPVIGFLILSMLFINCDSNHEFARDPSVLNTVSPSDPVTGDTGDTTTNPNTGDPNCFTCGNYTPTTGIGSGEAQHVIVSTAADNSSTSIANSETNALNYAVIDSDHQAYTELRVWKDWNANGVISDSAEAASELTTLAQEGILSLSLDTSGGSAGTYDAYLVFSGEITKRGYFLRQYPSGN